MGTYAYQKFVASYDERSTGTLVENKALSEHVRSVTIEFDNEQNYRPGDFYFIRFSGKGISSEFHPFSVASSLLENKRTIRFIIQSVGDYTSDIKNIPTGTKVFVEEPFGDLMSLLMSIRNHHLFFMDWVQAMLHCTAWH